MDASMISRLIAVVPERSARAHTGTPFAQAHAQLAQLVRHLGWLSPLNPLSREDQGALGQLSAHARLALREEENEELEADESSLVGD
ncbi:MAG TPA: hypothetical protein VML57_01495 [Burkholderiales bacterium]|nr:hypothetical protein [Burkholderiales bacterium]